MDATLSPPAAETKTLPPLLPPILLGPTSFLWLWVLPVGLLFLLNLQGYWVVEGNMSFSERHQAIDFGLAGVADLVAGLGLFGLAQFRRRDAGSGRMEHLLWGLPGVVVQVAYLWLAVSSVDGKMLPASVTVWIYPEQRFLFNQFAFAMLPLFHGILRMACARPAAATGTAIALNLGLAFLCPVALFALFTSIRVLGGSSYRWDGYVVAIGLIVLGILMFIGIVRALLLVLRKLQDWHVTGERWAIVLLALVLPGCGLLLNRTIPFPVDFQAWEVYALVAANTTLLLVASWWHPVQPRLCFCLLSATLPFSLYFFIVFLPYTPLSILAIIALGVGFLVLTPTFLFTLHLHLLNKAWRNPAVVSDRMRLALAGLGCSLLLPAFFTLRGLADKAALNAALDYVHAPAINRGDLTYAGSLSNLQRALSSHRSYKNGLCYPLLSDYYAWLVFDNLVLPDDQLTRLEKIFLGRVDASQSKASRAMGFFGGGRRVGDRARLRPATPPSHAVEVDQLNVQLAPADGQNTTATFILTLRNTGGGAAEYLKTLPLPTGVYASGFRMHIGGQVVPGRIFEKKTALWVYTMIRDSERRDPGLLYYRTPTELELRAYPVNESSPVTVELDFLVPVRLNAASLAAHSKDAAEVLAGLSGLFAPQLARDAQGNPVVAGLAARSLPGVEREAYLHVIVDRSAENGFVGDLPAALRGLREQFPASTRVRITLANYDVVDLVPALTPIAGLPALPADDVRHVLPLAGGFALDLALAHAIRQHRDADLDQVAAGGALPPRPIFVILSQKAAPRTLELDLTEAWADLLPGLEIYERGSAGEFVTQYNRGSAVAPLLRSGNSRRPLAANTVTRFAAGTQDAPLEYWSPAASAWQVVPDVRRQKSTAAWARAVALQLQQQDYDRSPGDASMAPSGLVKASRETGVLLRATSYIVVENEAQWRMLALGERQKLGQNAALEFLETPAPPALWVGLGFGLWLGLRRWRKCIWALFGVGRALCPTIDRRMSGINPDLQKHLSQELN